MKAHNRGCVLFYLLYPDPRQWSPWSGSFCLGVRRDGSLQCFLGPRNSSVQGGRNSMQDPDDLMKEQPG